MGGMNRRRFLETGIDAGAGVAAGTFASMSQASTVAGSLRAGVAKSNITTDARGVRISFCCGKDFASIWHD